MQRFTLKIVCFLCCLLFIVAVGNVQAAKSSARHVSNRVKIERPEKPSAAPAETAAEKSDKPAEEAAVAEKPAPEKEAGAPEKPAEEKSVSAREQTASREKPADAEEMRKEAIGLLGEKQELYARKGRIDPFAPFVQGPKPERDEEAQKKLERRKPQTPLERLSLGQLELTAIMETPEQRLAMVEEASGKGYVVKKGTYIGDQGGRITEILSEAIVIEEKYLDVFGKVDVREKQLKLQK
ncbi:MAG: pilus assembly protein PilP [Desulfobacterales bacterium]|nr:pilus assembly protein PilP [Desulfobacterales bacterium]